MTTPEPSRPLPRAARSMWRVQLFCIAVLAAVPVAAMAGLLAGGGVVVLGAAVAVVVPELRWRRWRYEIREDEIDLRHGLFTIRRTLVPIRRIQHVDTSSGLLQNAFGLATVIFHTAAGATEIPALMRPEADELRGRVGALAKALDDV